MITESKLAKSLSEGKFVITTQLSLSPDTPLAKIREKARLFKDFTAIFAGDESKLEINLSSFALSMILKEEGIEPVLQINSRDKNRIAIQKEILSAATSGINNICIVSGMHPANDKSLGSKAVYDLDPINIISMMKKIKEDGKLLDGKEIAIKPDLFIGVENNPLGEPFEAMPLFLEKKVRAGADFILTQPIFNVERLKEFLDRFMMGKSPQDVNIIASVFLLKSQRDMEYLKETYPGINIPSSIKERFMSSSSKEEEGKKIISDIIESLKKIKGIKGLNIITTSDREEDLVSIIEEIG